MKNQDGYSYMRNICIACIHHTMLAGTSDHFCMHPNYVNEPDLVTGTVVFPKCGDMRSGDCGKEGKFYQEKPAPRHGDLKPISNRDLAERFRY